MDGNQTFMECRNIPMGGEGGAASPGGDASAFSELVIQEVLRVPFPEGIARILRSEVSPVLGRTDTGKTPRGTSAGGQVLTGSKLTAEGKFRLKLEYLSKREDSRVNTGELVIPFCCYIILGEKADPPSRYRVSCLIDDVCVRVKDFRHVFYSIAAHVTAEPVLNL